MSWLTLDDAVRSLEYIMHRYDTPLESNGGTMWIACGADWLRRGSKSVMQSGVVLDVVMKQSLRRVGGGRAPLQEVMEL